MFYFLLSNNIHSQILKGKIIDIEGRSIRNASISISNENLCYTNNFGKFNVKLNEGLHLVYVNHINYKNKTIEINLKDNQTKKLNIILERKINLLDDVEIIEEKSEKIITDVLSINVIDSEKFQGESNSDLSDIVQRFSGITLTDNQISIRGGSGWNAMAGSRVLVLIDDIPLLSGDMGQIPWDLIPIENIDQIEVTKGAASAIYGSSAMNGVINVKTKTANQMLISQHPFIGHTKIISKYGVYDNPKNINLKWWDGTDHFILLTSYTQILSETHLTLGLNHFKDNGYRYLEENKRNQLSLYLLHNSKKIENLLYGISGTFMKQNVGNFLLWESYDNAYIPIDSNLYQTNSTLFHIDPYLNFTTQNGKHSIKNRYMRIGLDNSTIKKIQVKIYFQKPII